MPPDAEGRKSGGQPREVPLDHAAACRRVKKRCLRLPRAYEDFPFGESVAVYKVQSKIFAILDEHSVSLKCDPGYAVAVREQYPAVSPGYHLNKRHWNTVRLDGSVPAEVLDDWIEESYALVVAGLPRAQRPVPLTG
jgi:predicted DNA-binding protein (MmcQ/YjbR family)